ncbi:MAG: DUF1028 domain-containing protein [bacterium]
MTRRRFILCLCAIVVMLSVASVPAVEKPQGTFSVVGYDPSTGDLGVAVQSRFFGVGSVVPYAEAGVGAIATQAFGNTTYGPRGLTLLKLGMSAGSAVSLLTTNDGLRDQRQVGIVDAHGSAAAFTGKGTLDWAGNIGGEHFSVQGNILASEPVLKAMADAYQSTNDGLAEKLLAALDAGQAAGGDKRGKQSAALLVVRAGGGYAGYNDRFIDLRVEDNPEPLIELRRLYNLWQKTFGVGARLATAKAMETNGNGEGALLERRKAYLIIQDILKEKPDDAQVLNASAWDLCSNIFNVKEGLEIAKRAVALAPKDWSIVDTLAECYYANGMYDEAIATETEALNAEPENTYYAQQIAKYRAAKEKMK